MSGFRRVVRHLRKASELAAASARSVAARARAANQPRCDVCGRFVAFRRAVHAEPGVLRHPICDSDRNYQERCEREDRERRERRTDERLLGGERPF